MFSAVLQMIYYWKWEKGQAVLILFYVAVGIFFTVAIGCFVILTNVANFDKEFVSGYLKSCALAFDSFWQTTQNEQQLPRYWNDPKPQTGQIPTNLTPPPTTSLQEPPAATGSTTGETENVYKTIYSNLPPEYENPPSYGDSVIQY
jgi:hypothetical protein